MKSILSLVEKHKCYFIADIAANHDGDLNRAKDLIYLAKESGAHVAKFQHFQSKDIVSPEGFENLAEIKTHQSNWKKSVSEIYDQYHTKREWDEELYKTCLDADIEFMTTPYDVEAIIRLNDYVNSFKIGSGDITYKKLIEEILKTQKNVILATGASDMPDVTQAMDLITATVPLEKIALLQCNTNYTAQLENFKYINLNVLQTYKRLYPQVTLGLSDHTPGHATVLGAITLGAEVIEKHFTDDNQRQGPDHKFAMNPKSWCEMVERSQELIFSLGGFEKQVEHNEKESIIVQRRSVRAARDLKQGTIISAEDITYLRPCTQHGVSPWEYEKIIGKVMGKKIKKGEEIRYEMFD